MPWDSEQPQQPWHRAFAGIEIDGQDLSDYIAEDPEASWLIDAGTLEAIAARINELSAIVAQNALTAIPETEDDK